MLLVKTEVRPSQIHGLGVFAAEFIAKGDPVWRFVDGFDFLISDVDSLPAIAQEEVLNKGWISKQSGRHTVCFDGAQYINHSDFPSLITVETEDPDGCAVAARDLYPGDEITEDYRTFDVHAEEKLNTPTPRRET